MTSLMTIENFTDNQEQFMTDLIETRGDNLPAKIEDVIQVFEFTDFKAKAFKMMADKAKKLDEQSEIYHSALRSGQKWGIATLYSQKRMGDITNKMPIKQRRSNQYLEVSGQPDTSKSKELSDKGISKTVYLDAQRLADNPEILERVINNMTDRGEIPTKTAVLNTIRVEKYRENEAKKINKHNDRLVKEIPKPVKDYFNVLAEMKQGLHIALEVANRGLFSPESINIIKKKHAEIKEMFDQVEGFINE